MLAGLAAVKVMTTGVLDVMPTVQAIAGTPVLAHAEVVALAHVTLVVVVDAWGRVEVVQAGRSF